MELVCYQETNSTRNYGYNEMTILQKCHEQSRFLRGASLIAKITGRNIVKNINLILSQIRSPRGNFFAAETGLKIQYINARCFFFTSGMWDKVIALKGGVGAISYKEIREGKIPPPGIYVDVETAYGSLIRKELRKDRKAFRLLHYPIDISGVSGYYGTTIDMGLGTKIVQYMKSMIKSILFEIKIRRKMFFD